MALSKLYESTILKVRVSFGFFGFSCDPSEITTALEIEPDDVRREGETRSTKWGTTFTTHESSWSLRSTSESKDVNIHIRELLARIAEKEAVIRQEWNPAFSVLWKGTYLYAGSGPFYEADVVRGMSRLHASLWQDIYQDDEEGN